MDYKKYYSQIYSSSVNSKEQWICPICKKNNTANRIECVYCNHKRNYLKNNKEGRLNPEYEKEIEKILKEIPMVKSIAIDNEFYKVKSQKERSYGKQNLILQNSWKCVNCKIINNTNFCPNCGIPKPI